MGRLVMGLGGLMNFPYKTDAGVTDWLPETEEKSREHFLCFIKSAEKTAPACPRR
jgi:hypothetical protein